jgi:hypothetical protein
MKVDAIKVGKRQTSAIFFDGHVLIADHMARNPRQSRTFGIRSSTSRQPLLDINDTAGAHRDANSTSDKLGIFARISIRVACPPELYPARCEWDSLSGQAT